jgi:chemotaxis family two-component system sensor kinase Cph1
MACPQDDASLRLTEPAKRFQGRRILLVEDQGLVAMELQDLLESHGAIVIGPLGRLKAALAEAEDAVIDAALLDVDLNGEYSWPVADMLVSRDIPFAFTTGFQAKMVVPERFAHTPAVNKPYRQDALLATLSGLLKGAAQ